MADTNTLAVLSSDGDIIELGRQLSTKRWKLSMAKLFLTTSGRARFYEKLAVLRQRNVRLNTALRTIWESETRGGTSRLNSPLGMLLPVALYRMHELGDQWHLAFRDWIPSIEGLLLGASPDVGLTVDILKSLADIARRQAKWNGALFRVFGPAYFAIGTIVVVFYYSAVKFFPILLKVAPHIRLTGSAGAFQALSQFMLSYGNIVIPATLLFPFALVYTLPRWTGAVRRRFDKMPGFSFYKRWTGAGFILALAALVRAHQRERDAVRQLGSWASPYMAERIDAILQYDNLPLADAMDATGYEWPDDETIRSIKIYLSGVNPDEGLQALANDWLDTLTANMAASADWLALGVNAVLALFIVWYTVVTQDVANTITAAARVHFHF